MYEAEMKLHYMHAPRIICLINSSSHSQKIISLKLAKMFETEFLTNLSF